MRLSPVAHDARTLIAASMLAGSVVIGSTAFGHEVQAGPPVEEAHDEVGETRAEGGSWTSRNRTDGAALGEDPIPSEPAGVVRSASLTATEEGCAVEMKKSTHALNVATYFSWYRSRAQFKCMSSQPIEGFFRSKNRGRIRTHLKRLDDHGFHAIAGVIYADPADDSRAATEMRWMLKAVREARRLGFQFIPLYDFSIASHLSANLCNVFAGRCTPDDVKVEEYNFDRHPVLQSTVLENLVMIADRFILPFADLENPSASTARFLHDAEGNVVRDATGLPRPEVYIYIPRVWTDDTGFATVAKTLETVTEAYRERGLGMPAYTLDVMMPLRKPFSTARLAAFGESAVRVTPFFAATNRARNLGELAKEHRRMYRRAQRRLSRAINKGKIHPRLQIAGGTVVNFDKRGWSACQEGFNGVYWPALSPDHWMQALDTLVQHTTEPVCSDGEGSPGGAIPFQNGRFLYADEGFEATWLCAEVGPDGQKYPNRYGCEPLEGFAELMGQLGEL